MKYHFTNLSVYQSADELVHQVFDLTEKFPRTELFNTTSQLRRASLSIVLNIVEGNAKRFSSTKEFVRFLYIAYGSLLETEYLLQFSLKRNFITETAYKNVLIIHGKCAKELYDLKKYQELKSKQMTHGPKDQLT